MDLQNWLASLLTVAGGGVALWAVVAFVINVFPALDGNPSAKFWLALVLAFVIPAVAYAGEIWLGYAAFSYEGLFLAVGTGYLISQGVHRGTEQLRGKRSS